MVMSRQLRLWCKWIFAVWYKRAITNMQIIKRNQKNKRFTAAIMMCCLSILVLSAIIIVAPSLSFQSQTNNNSKYSTDNNPNNSHQIAVFSADSKPYGLTYGDWTHCNRFPCNHIIQSCAY
jgi:hypothetical protein